MSGPYKNPSNVTIALNKGVTYLVQAFSNAALAQCVQITPPAGSGAGSAAQFDGTGENNKPMSLTTPGFLTAGAGGSWCTFTVKGDVGSGQSYYKISASNSNGNQGGIEANTSSYGMPGNWQFVATFVSYDDNGGSPDFNDSFLIFTAWYALPSA